MQAGNWLLLLETSFRCDPNDNALDCFKYHLKFWDLKTIKNFSREAIDCNSAVARNGTVEVQCYKIVLNFGLAAGASYGSYHISMAFFNVAAAALLMVKEVKTICKLRVSLVVLSLVFIGAYIMVAATSFRYYFVSDNLVIVLQGMVSVITGYLFMFAIPWKKLIALKQVDHQSATKLRAVSPFIQKSDERGQSQEEEGDHEELGSRKRQRTEEGQESRELEGAREGQRSQNGSAKPQGSSRTNTAETTFRGLAKSRHGRRLVACMEKVYVYILHYHSTSFTQVIM